MTRRYDKVNNKKGQRQGGQRQVGFNKVNNKEVVGMVNNNDGIYVKFLLKMVTKKRVYDYVTAM